MTCTQVRMMNGAVGWVCSRGARRRACSFCKSRDASLQCDYALRGKRAGHTCDAFMCAGCAVRQRDEALDTIDYCPPHARLAANAVQIELVVQPCQK